MLFFDQSIPELHSQKTFCRGQHFGQWEITNFRFAIYCFAKYRFAIYRFAKYRFAIYRFAKYRFVNYQFAKYRQTDSPLLPWGLVLDGRGYKDKTISAKKI